MADELPYRAEYAKSGRSSCQNCKNKIDKDVLRIATIVQSPIYDGTMARWYHGKCFFIKQRPKAIGDIANFDTLRWEDQEDIKAKIEEASKLPPPTTGKGRKRGSSAKTTGPLKDFLVEYAKSNRSTCSGCQEKITKGEMRVSKKDFESEEGRRYGGIDRWHHLECFTKLRADFEFYESGDVLPGAQLLSKEDRQTLMATLPKIKGEGAPPVKKLKDEPEDKLEKEALKKQNEEMYKIRNLFEPLKKNALVLFLEKNGQGVPAGVPAMLDHLTDIGCFGALKPCPKCNGQLVYNSGIGYKCTGNVTEWTKCEYTTQDPKRKKIIIPSDLKDQHPELASLKIKVKRRLIHIVAPSTSTLIKKEDTTDEGPKVQPKLRPLKYMEFVIIGRTEKDKELLKREIYNLGGTVGSKINENLAAVISTVKEVDKMNKKMEEVKALDIQVISEDFVEEAKDYTNAPVMLIKKKTISPWGGDPSIRISNVVQKSNVSKGKSKFEKSGPGKVKLQVKGAGTVDPESGLEDCAHIYQKGKDKFTVTLGLTDIQSKKNSYYKLQILKHDKMDKFWVFRSWGRIGTTIGGTKVEQFPLKECILLFENLYEDKTGNTWKQRANFVKVPDKMYPLDIDEGNDEKSAELLKSDIKSNLHEAVQHLIKLIFDVQNMKKVMLEFEIDTEKMPLGKLSKKQIQKAYAVLTDLQELMKKNNTEHINLVDASNKFYTLIPHSFGVSGPKILETVDEIKQKCEMLDALLEMEIAYNLLHSGTDDTKNPLDAHYEQLKADIDILDKRTDEFKVIQQYVQNTHASTHSHYRLEIEEVFTIKRHGEEQRYKPFKKLPNKKLLWHGSRSTNFAGILSQGLRIAPPEAPVTGYMFGKGIYFADMVSKSANYCCTNSENSTGLLLLCEVALGNMYEKYQADYIEKLPKGKHATFGRGKTHPDPEVVHKMDDGVEVPYGTGVDAKLNKTTSLLYNEYVVYDVAQVKTKYLLKINFKYDI